MVLPFLLWQKRYLFTPMLTWSVLYMSMSAFNFGYDTSLFASIQGMASFDVEFGVYNDLQHRYIIAPYLSSIMNSTPFLGKFIGTLMCGPLMARYGRKPAMFAIAIISIIGVILQCATTTAAQFTIGRILCYLSTGITIGVVPAYQSETAPAELRGAITATLQLWIGVGQVLGSVITNATQAMPTRAAWLIPTGLQFIIPVVILIGYPFVPESPRWLLSQGRKEEAVGALLSIRPKGTTVEEVEYELRLMAKAMAEQQQSGPWKDLFKGANRRRTLIAVGAMACQQITVGGYKDGTSLCESILGDLLSAIRHRQSISFLAKRHWNDDERPILLVGSFFVSLWLFVLGGIGIIPHPNQVQKNVLVAANMLFGKSYDMSWAPLSYVIMGEVASNRLREKTVNLATSVSVIITFLVTFTLPYLLNAHYANLGAKVGYIYGAFSILTFFFALFYVPEMKNRSLEEIDEMFAAKISALKSNKFQSTGIGRQILEAEEAAYAGNHKKRTVQEIEDVKVHEKVARKVKCDADVGVCGNCQRLNEMCRRSSDDAKDVDGVKQLLGRTLTVTQAGTKRRRTLISCINCRNRKRKCTGERPTCARCKHNKLECQYDFSAPSVSPTNGHGLTTVFNTSPTSPPSITSNERLPEKAVVRSLVEKFFRDVYPCRLFGFLHKPSFMLRLDDDYGSTIDERMLLLVICALATKINHEEDPKLWETGNTWATEAQSFLVACINRISVSTLMVVVLLHEHEFRAGRLTACFLLSGMAARLSQALQINLEYDFDVLCVDSSMTCTEKECRRRLMWAFYLLDTFTSSGVRQLQLINEGDIKIQLPCSEDNFLFQRSCITETITPGEVLKFVNIVDMASPPASNMDYRAHIVRIMSLRNRVLVYVKHFHVDEDPWSPTSGFSKILADLALWRSNLPADLLITPSIIYIRKEQGLLSAILHMHLLYHLCFCDLYRIVMPGLSYPPTSSMQAIEIAAPVEFLVQSQDSCFEHANAMSDIFDQSLFHRSSALYESASPIAAHEATRVQLLYVMRIAVDRVTDDKLMETMRRIEINMDYLLTMCKRFPTTKRFVSSVEKVLHKHGLSVNKSASSSTITPRPTPSSDTTPEPGESSPPQTSADYKLHPLSAFRILREEISEKHAPQTARRSMSSSVSPTSAEMLDMPLFTSMFSTNFEDWLVNKVSSLRPTDDASWVKVVLETLEAVVVSVDYRLAPVYPFPTAVDDGADAILYLVRQAEEFGIDPASIVLTGFSSGGNLAFTVPLKLEELKQEEVLQEDNGSLSADAWQSISSQPLNKPLIQTPSYNITAVVSWYPSTDYTITRSQRRSTCARPELTLSATFAELFDTAYLYPPGGDLHHPYLSPGVAPNEILAALPDNLIIYTCEWDMLQDEAYRFGQRLKDLGKKVQLCMIENVQHAWDKKPRLRPDAAVELLYREACFQLKQILENIHGHSQSKAEVRRRRQQARSNEREEYQREIENRRRKEDERAAQEDSPDMRQRYGFLSNDKMTLAERKPDSDLHTLSCRQYGDQVTMQARVHAIRNMGPQLTFIVLRQRALTIQSVLHRRDQVVSSHMMKWIARLRPEDIVLVRGILTKPPKTVEGASIRDTEIDVREIFLISQVTQRLPFSVYAIDQTNTPISHATHITDRKRLMSRIVDLRTPVSQAIFRVNAGICTLFRSYLEGHDFIEIHTPKLQASATESGSSVFQVNYFGREAFLAQSPQLSKQMCIAADFGKVYEIGPVFRAENSNTHRHLTEYTGLDLEMTIDGHYHEAMELIDDMLKSVFAGIHKRYRSQLDLIKTQFPAQDIVWLEETPRLSFTEGVRLLHDSGWTDENNEPPSEEADLSTPAEIRLGELVREKYGTDYYILDKFPASARPFYTMLDPENPKFTNSFDIFLRGQEILTGGQRIHDPKMLEQRMRESGVRPETMEEYMNGFRWGAPPHAGAGIGLERLVMLMLGLGNIRLGSLFPRDPKSLHSDSHDLKLRHPEASTLHPPWNRSPNGNIELQPLEKLIANYGDASNTSWVDDRYQKWRDMSTGAAVAYVPTDGFAILMGDPLCDKSQFETIISQFLAWLKQETKLDPIWLLTSYRVQEILSNKFGWRVVSCAAEQRTEPGNHSIHKKERRSERAGISFTEVPIGDDVPETIKDQCDQGIQEWLNHRSGTQVSISHIDPWKDQEHRTYVYAQDQDGRVCALVVLAQLSYEHGYQVKWALDFPGAPNGTIETAISRALQMVASTGCKQVTFGAGATATLSAQHHIHGLHVKLLSHSYAAIAKAFKLADINEFMKSMDESERKLLTFSITHGSPADSVLEKIRGKLSEGDIILDGGNEHYRDTERRQLELDVHGIKWIGMGVSGGYQSARHGPSMSPGDDKDAVDMVLPLLEKFSAKDTKTGKPCVVNIGPRGSGHYVKMVHNGIENGMLSTMCEAFGLLHKSLGLSYNDIGDIFEKWNSEGELKNTYLVQIGSEICRRRKTPRGDGKDEGVGEYGYVLDDVLEKG
ncbi:hypothetical protein BZG36_05103, partial [Bifiguratus adelaidae]